MLSITDLSLRIGPRLLLKNATVTLFAGQKVGIIGRNGTGKTSLFRLLMGELQPDAGEVTLPGQVRKAWMRQETAASDRSALDYVLDGHGLLRKLESALAEADTAGDDSRLAIVHSELDAIEAYSLPNRAEQLLSGLGFGTHEFSQPVSAFSGGWRIRLNLAQALMRPSDLLLLDEPTNHLDLEATIWLQQWLKSYQGTLLLISHDREFLDGITTHILSLENQELVLTRGNYSAYEVQKAERLSQQEAAFRKQQQRVDEIESFVRRFRAKATKARQAQSRLKELKRMELIAPAHIDSPFTFRFRTPDKLPQSLLIAESLTIGYGDVPLVSNIELGLRSDSRIGLLGANGQGKSTLLKVLSGQLAAITGELHGHDYLRIGYMAQHHIDTLDLDASPMQLLVRVDRRIGEQEARNFLGGFAFTHERVDEPATHFSGGEKARLALALLVWQKPNLLLLDEPTNHLDLEMRHALTMALQSFEGALVVVSHDRHLLNNVVDQFLLVKDGRLSEFEGDLHDYERLLGSSSSASPPASAAEKNDRQDRKSKRQQSAQDRQKRKPLTGRLKKVESRMELIHKRSIELDKLLGDETLYEENQQKKLQALIDEKAELLREEEALESEWLEISSALETMDS